MSHSTEKTNRLDQGLGMFLQQYKYEILASLILVALILGGIAATIIFKNSPPEQIAFSSTEEESSDELPSTIWVDIGGAVNQPGLFEIEAGSRVSDIIEKANGLNDEADQGWVERNINLAQTLQDGQKIYVPSKEESDDSIQSNGSVEAAVSDKININSASKEKLMSLSGIGEKYADKIIGARPFQKIEDLLNIPGIGEKRFAEIKDNVSVY